MKNHIEEDYLWDQTSDPDPEIQELERVMGTLRYQPRPLVIPETLQPRSSFRTFGPLLAIAATLILAVGIGALWLTLERRHSSQVTKSGEKPHLHANSDKAAVTVPEDVLREFPNDPADKVEGALPGPGNPVKTPPRYRPNQTGAAEDRNRRRAVRPATPLLTANELKEAEAGKAKLMLALRVASEKLNGALKKAQGTNNSNLIHNQHKIG
jgi:hypothetical protein